MPDPRTPSIKALHRGPWLTALAITGGGAGAIARLLQVPGASNTVLDAQTPYARRAVSRFLGFAPPSYCGLSAARSLAAAAWRQAVEALDAEVQESRAPDVLGVGATCSLRSTRPKRGPHRVIVAVQGWERMSWAELEVHKGRRSRLQEERLAANLILDELFQAVALPGGDLELLPGEQVARGQAQGHPQWNALWLRQCDALCVTGEGEVLRDAPAPQALLPGAFNPVHRGHRLMRDAAQQLLQRPVAYELSIENVDKPPLTLADIRDRLRHFQTGDQIWLTRAPRFRDKAQLFPNTWFLVGADTARRIPQASYYANLQQRDQTMQVLQQHGCRFLVFGRLLEQSFWTLNALELPDSFRQLCDEVPAESFRCDLSSTELRTRTRDRI